MSGAGRPSTTASGYYSVVAVALVLGCAGTEETRAPSTLDTSGQGGAGTTTTGSIATGVGGMMIIDVEETTSTTTGQASGGGPQRDPVTCQESEEFRTYLGCEYFPTVLGNVVHPEFDYAVVVANASDDTADVDVTGPGGFTTSTSVAAGALEAVYLPWVDELKGPSLDASCETSDFDGSVSLTGGAYVLTSSRPVAAYQFSPLQFRAAGGPPGKTWACVPETSSPCECNSYTNDASLLLPKNALTANYTVPTWREDGAGSSKPAYIAITGIVDATLVTVKVGPGGQIAASADGTLAGANAGEVFDLMLNRADVVELLAVPGSDLSGTLVQASDDKPVQVMTGSASTNVPDPSVRSADHIEELVFPAEALGNDYVVTVPTGPYGEPVSHVVRLYAHVDTALTYAPAPPQGAPTSLVAGEVGEFQTSETFQVQSDQPFAVGSFLVGGQLLDPDAPSNSSTGDPSQSFATALAQYRDTYVFLAPVDYESNFADIVAPTGTAITLDGRVLDAATASPLSGKSADGQGEQVFDVYRVPLDSGPSGTGAHRLSAEVPMGLQVVGYGRFTSYQYPGGLNLNLISEPPIPIIR